MPSRDRVDRQKADDVPIARMYGIKEGPSDTHYGNNGIMPPGNYTVEIAVKGEKAGLPVTVQAP